MHQALLGAAHPIREALITGAVLGLAVGVVIGMAVKTYILEQRTKLDAWMSDSAASHAAADPLEQDWSDDPTVKVYPLDNDGRTHPVFYDREAE